MTNGSAVSQQCTHWVVEILMSSRVARVRGNAGSNFGLPAATSSKQQTADDLVELNSRRRFREAQSRPGSGRQHPDR